MKIIKLSKTVLSVRGDNAASFLNGLMTNTVDQVKTAFVDVHARTIAVGDLKKMSDREFVLVVESAYVDKLLAHLDRFARLSKVALAKESYSVYYDCLCDVVPKDGDLMIAQRAGQLWLTRGSPENTISATEFLLFRLRNNIPLQGQDFDDEMLLNIHETEFVSYTKGCFLGQEPIAKVHNRSRPTWKLEVRYKKDLSEEMQAKMTSIVKDPQSQTDMGFVFVKNE